MKKYKNELNDALRRNRDIGEVKKHEYSEVEKEKNKFKKINSELKIIIQKQSKLVEVLRKKCAHLGMHSKKYIFRDIHGYARFQPPEIDFEHLYIFCRKVSLPRLEPWIYPRREK